MVQTSRNTGSSKKRKSESSSGGEGVAVVRDENETIITDMTLSRAHAEEDHNIVHNSIENTPKSFMSNLQAMVCLCVCVSWCMRVCVCVCVCVCHDSLVKISYNTILAPIYAKRRKDAARPL
jgi:hypothetical protein